MWAGLEEVLYLEQVKDSWIFSFEHRVKAKDAPVDRAEWVGWPGGGPEEH